MLLFGKLSPFKRRLVKNLSLTGLAASVFGIAVIIVWISTFRIPTLDSFETRRVVQSTKIYDRTGEVLLYDLSRDIHRTVVPLSEISQNIVNATLAIEDKNFYQNRGIEIKAILRAIFANLTNLEIGQGGSTITQQVIKNSLLTSEKLISRKLKEWILAPQLEKKLSKNEILSIYLNEIPYGGSLYGVEAASEAFFNKKASDVSIAEAAYMAAVIKAPTYYSPYGRHRDDLDKRKNLVLKEMLEDGRITKQEYNAALAENAVFAPQTDRGIKAPHFVMFVKEYLENKYGPEALERGGLKVITTLDYDLQEKAEVIVNKYALQNARNFNATNAALTAVDPTNGQILVMVGSRAYFDEEIDGNYNITTALRQPGSAFKPFAYAEAFIKGYTPETVLFDLPTEFSTDCTPEGVLISGREGPCYMPTNYDSKYRGPITMREALAQSINIPSIKTFYLAGMTDTLNLAKNMGITSLGDINRYGLTLVLGGGEVSLLDLTSAYGVFAAGGIKNSTTPILEVLDAQDGVLEQFTDSKEIVLDSETSAKISSILSDNVARAPLYGANSPLYFPNYTVAAKTGTTNDYRDAWIIGYTPTIAVGAWAGNNDNSPMEKKISGLIIAPLWNEFMQTALPNHNGSFPEMTKENFDDLKPVLRGYWQGGISYIADKVSVGMATEQTPDSSKIETLSGGVHSILYWVDKDNPRGPAPTRPDTDPQFYLWEYAVRKWAEQNNIQDIFMSPPQNTIPQEISGAGTDQL